MIVHRRRTLFSRPESITVTSGGWLLFRSGDRLEVLEYTDDSLLMHESETPIQQRYVLVTVPKDMPSFTVHMLTNPRTQEMKTYTFLPPDEDYEVPDVPPPGVPRVLLDHDTEDD